MIIDLNSTGLDTIETYRGPDSVLYGSDAGASVVSFTTPHGGSPHPLVTYSGDAGNFHTYRDEATLSGAHKKFDYYTAFSRFDTSNALPLDRYHSATSAAPWIALVQASRTRARSATSIGATWSACA